jgi:carbon-monoxide dehydrogenase small subunit
MNGKSQIRFTLNGEAVSASIWPGQSAVDVLTNQLNLTGARESCGQGLCGCCTIYVGDVAVSGCLYLADRLDGQYVTTIEGLSKFGEPLHPVQQAFVDENAFQCGFCTPGFIMMTIKLIEAHSDPDPEQISHYLAGNLCRCSAYPEIVRAVQLAAKKMRNAEASPP